MEAQIRGVFFLPMACKWIVPPKRDFRIRAQQTPRRVGTAVWRAHRLTRSVLLLRLFRRRDGRDPASRKSMWSTRSALAARAIEDERKNLDDELSAKARYCM